MTLKPYEQIARLLRTDKTFFKEAITHLENISSKKNILDKIVSDNDALILHRLDKLNLQRSSYAEDVYNALIRKMEIDDRELSLFLNNPSPSDRGCCELMLKTAKNLVNPKLGFFLKLEKAKELIEKKPPLKVIEALGYKDVSELLVKEDIYNIYAALRFVEGSEWLNKVFFKQYEDLTSDDFEFREITYRAMDSRWVHLSEGFVKKKYHNLSHLKELGFVFSLPVSLGIAGEVLRGFTLMLHYFNEIAFYSSLFLAYARDNNFSSNLISLLRGDAVSRRLKDASSSTWLIIPRYFAKDDPYDWRLFEPHLNPEALHWERAERNLASLPIDLSFWSNLGWIAGEFSTPIGIDVKVSFNIVDTAMSLVKQKELVKYLYHEEEALWNKIILEHLGEEKMEQLMKEGILTGWVNL